MGEVTFTVPGRLPGYNQLTKGHWATCHQRKKEAMEIVMWCIRAARMQPAKGKVTVEIHCFEPNRTRDDDNVTSGASKVILDALQRCGILAGDGQRYVRCVKHPVEVDRKNPRIDVTISHWGIS